MRTYLWVGIGVLVLAALNFFGILQPLNEAIPQSPDLSCRSDADCALRAGDCTAGCRSMAANKEWTPFCPFHDARVFDVCADPGFEAKCSAGVCIAVNASGL